jgi:hypothetical protein
LQGGRRPRIELGRPGRRARASAWRRVVAQASAPDRRAHPPGHREQALAHFARAVERAFVRERRKSIRRSAGGAVRFDQRIGGGQS